MAFGGTITVDPEQGPPLRVPAGFFLIAPAAILGAGAILCLRPAALTSRWLPETIALTHLGTLGLLGAVMLGALYQMLPVVAGAPVRRPGLGHGVQLLLLLGLAALVSGFLGGGSRADGGAPLFAGAVALLGLGLTGAWLQLSVALVRAPRITLTVAGMGVALLGLGATVALGLVLATYRAGVFLPVDRLAWSGAHLGLGVIVWVGGLVSAVSWQVVPMFYLTPAYPRWVKAITVAALGATLLGLPLALALGGTSGWLALAALPGCVAAWLVHPAATLWLLARARRRRVDWSRRFWLGSMSAAPVALALLAATLATGHPRLPVLLGWTALWGWAALVVHGMLTRIVPFLVWFHRYASLVGTPAGAEVPTMASLLPGRQVRVGFVLHLATLAGGWAAVLGASPVLARATGVMLAATGALLLAALLRPLLHGLRPGPPAPGRAAGLTP